MGRAGGAGEPTTLLHILVEQLHARAPAVLAWAADLGPRAQQAPKAASTFLSFFPRTLERLRQLESAILKAEEGKEKEKEKELLAKLQELRAELTARMKSLSESTRQLDQQLKFLGGAPPEEQEEGEGASELRRLWTRLGEKDVLLLRTSECVKMAKKDETRISFFRSLDSFFADVKKAHQFHAAQREKSLRQASLKAARARQEKEEEEEEEDEEEEQESDEDDERTASAGTRPRTRLVPIFTERY